MIQYSRDVHDQSRGRGVLDTPLEPVIGLAEGETRWRGMTVLPIVPDGQITSCFPKCAVQSLLQKYFYFGQSQISSLIRAVPSRKRGVAHVTNVGRDAVDAGSACDEWR